MVVPERLRNTTLLFVSCSSARNLNLSASDERANGTNKIMGTSATQPLHTM
jgi:hypothetical protein